MIHRAIRNLPIEPKSCFDSRVIQQIKAITEDEIKYTKAEVDWMYRALENLRVMFDQARAADLDTSDISLRIDQISTQLEAALK